jgi:hypothetical protein
MNILWLLALSATSARTKCRVPCLDVRTMSCPKACNYRKSRAREREIYNGAIYRNPNRSFGSETAINIALRYVSREARDVLQVPSWQTNDNKQRRETAARVPRAIGGILN